jgi:hypothetical protein
MNSTSTIRIFFVFMVLYFSEDISQVIQNNVCHFVLQNKASCSEGMYQNMRKIG